MSDIHTYDLKIYHNFISTHNISKTHKYLSNFSINLPIYLLRIILIYYFNSFNFKNKSIYD